MSKIYQIEVTETLQRLVTVKADSMEDAIKVIKTAYDDQEIVLDSGDHTDTSITCHNEWDEELNKNEPDYDADDYMLDNLDL